MCETDLSAVQRISDEVHGRYSEAPAVYAERLRLYSAGCFVLDEGGDVSGYLITHPWHRDTPPKLGALLGSIPAEADTYYLHDIALLPSTRGSGAGRAATALVAQCAAACGQHSITLMAINGADRFWSAQGFDHVADGGDASYGEDAFLMRRMI